jgi:hypothetical protein
MKKIIVISSLLLTIGCSQKPNTIEPGDTVVKCVIDSISIQQERSTIEVGPYYTYYTDCGEKITTKNNSVYKIGDTITYDYKRVKR